MYDVLKADFTINMKCMLTKLLDIFQKFT